MADNKTDQIQQAWTRMSDTDKQVLLGHTDRILTPRDKVALAKAARAHGARLREGKPSSFRRGLGPEDRGYRGQAMDERRTR